MPIRAIATLTYGDFVLKITVDGPSTKSFYLFVQYVHSYSRQQHWTVLATGLEAVLIVANAVLEHNEGSVVGASLEDI